MDDSDQDFADICSKFVKRVRKKAVDPVLSRKAEPQSSSQTRNVTADPSKKTRKKKDVVSEYKPSQAKLGPGGDWAPTRRPEQSLVNGYALCDAGDGGPPGPTDSGEALHVVEGGQRARDKVLLRMQQFKRASPHMLVHDDRSDAVPEQPKGKDELPQETGSSHAALVLRLQPSQDPQAALDPEQQAPLDLCLPQDPDQQRVDSLEDRGLFFCQLCQRNLSHMTPEGRTQHLNRCLDETERGPAALGAPPPPPRVADCPICGKRFKAPKSRAAHLKRCSADMGVAPAVLLQCLQRQAAEVQSDGGDGPLPRGASRGSKRKEPADPSLPTRKRPRKKAQLLDEATQVALALSSSLLEREKELEREAAAALAAVAHRLQWRPEAGQGRKKGGKRKKGGPPRPPPLLLVQDALAAQNRVQERVAALLLRQRAPSPPTPPRCPSRLPSAPARPLWSVSALRDDADPRGPAQFYTPELRDLLLPRDPPGTTVASIAKVPLEPSIQSPVKADPQMTPPPPLPSPTPPCPSPSWAGTGRLSVGSQALRDVMDLADEGRSVSQWVRDEACGTAAVSDFPLSGFIPDKSEAHAKMGLSGFLPGDDDDDTAAAASSQTIRDSGRPGGQPESSWRESVALSRLSCDLSSMVNNPQLSDVQVQVDSGEVFFVHSFMLYARCPLLAQMVHDAGFGVQEEGLPSTQRVLLGESPGEAVLALLQYLYTGRCPAPPGPLLPPLLELATRFDLEELQSLAQLHLEEADSAPQEDAAEAGQPWDNPHPSPGVEPARGDQDFTKLLRSMWSEEEEEEEEEGGGEATAGTSVDRRDDGDDDGDDSGGGQRDGRLASGDGDAHEERVNDEEMEEIYEFAATQRKLAEEGESTGSEEEEEEDEDEEPTSAEDHVFTRAGGPAQDETPVCFEAPERSPGCQVPSSLSYSRLFSSSWDVCEEEFPASPPLSSPRPSTSRGPPKATPTPPQRRSPDRAFPRGDGAATLRSDATCLQSSPSEIIDLSDSPGPPGTPGLPRPGLSPGRHRGALDADAPGDVGPGNPPATDPGTSPKRESAGPRGICQPASPDPPRRRAEPELIVLSDSSSEGEEGAAPAASPGPSPPHSPAWSQRHWQYTQIKAPSLHPGPCTSPPEEGGDVQGPGWSDGAEEGGGDGGHASARGVGVAGQSPDQLGFSPEVSWLIPATPQQARHPSSSSSICTQTRSSMFRTRLFPRASASASPPPPPLPTQTPSSPRSKGRARGGSSASDGPPARSKRPESSLDAQPLPGTFGPPAPGARPPGFPHPPLSSSLTQSAPAHGHPGPYSSTPLHTRPPKPPVPLGTSLVRGDPAREELGRGHLSQSEPSRSVSPSSLCRDRSGPGGDADAGRSGRTLGSDHRHGNASESEKIGDAGEGVRGGDRGSGVEAAVERGAESEAGHERGSEPSFCQSFMDEPPMAFNDSWGLDGGGGGGGGKGGGGGEGGGGQAVCFSLRLEDSGEVGSHQHSPVSPHSLQHPHLTQNPSASRSPGTPPSPTTNACPPVDPDTPPRVPEVNGSLLDPQLWDSWQEEVEEQDEALPVSQKGHAAARFQTPVSAGSRKRTPLVPITPMPGYSDMDTPELKNKLDRFGVRPLPKRQMILKLRQIHQYTHQLVHSDEDEEEEEDGAAPLGGPGPAKPRPSARPPSGSQGPRFKRPVVPTGASPVKRGHEDPEPLSSSQGSSTSSTVASEESERSNPELLHSSDSESDGDGGVTASQAAGRQRDRVQAVRAFILSNADLHLQVLRYQPLVLSQLQARLKAAGIRLGAAKLMDYLDSQCITVTTAKPGGRPRRKGKAKGERGARGRKRKTAPATE